MIKRLAVTKGQEPTLEQLKEVEEAKKYPIEFDEDCPEVVTCTYGGIQECRGSAKSS